MYHDTNLSRLGAGSEYRVYCDTIPAGWELDQVKGLPGFQPIRLGAGSEYRVYFDTIPAGWELNLFKGLP